jgi:hypothetical protein
VAFFTSEHRIYGLPAELELVPAGPFSAQDPWRDERRQEYRTWKDDFLAFRAIRHAECEPGNPWYEEHRELELQKCAASAKYFTAMWGVLYEPRARKRRVGYGGSFVPFAKQIELFDAIDFALKVEDEDSAKRDIAVPKSRDVGASWCCVSQALHDWLWVPETQVRFVSYIEPLVDSKHTDSLFWKLRWLYAHLPDWMKPTGKEYTDNFLTFINHLNGNGIGGGTTTTRTGRAQRSSYIITDEAAQFDDFGDVWVNSVASADTRICVSSISLEFGDDFYRLALDEGMPSDEQPTRLRIDWFDHPLHDDKWYDNEKKSYALRPGKFQQEVELNPFVGNRKLIYPMMQQKAISTDVVFDIRYPQYVSMDPGVRDEFGVVFIQENPVDGWCDVLDGYMGVGHPAEFYGEFLSGSIGQPDGFITADMLRSDDELFRIHRWQAERHRYSCTYIGDPAGWSRGGASAESVFQVLGRYDVKVRRDYTTVRKKHGGSGRRHLEQAKEAAVSYRGRREAVMALMPRLRFADTPGARLVHRALREYKYLHDEEKELATEDQKPAHTWASHLSTAVEFYATNREIELRLWAMHTSGSGGLSSSSRRNRAPRPRRSSGRRAA